MSATDTDTVEVVDAEVVQDLVVAPHTGEALTLRDMDDERLARALDDVRVWERGPLSEFKRALQEEFLRRMDDVCEYTLHADGYKIAGDSNNRTDVDGQELHDALRKLVDAGEVPLAAAGKAIVTKLEIAGFVDDEELLARAKKVEYVAVRAGMAALKRRGGLAEDTVESCERPTAKPRGVRVTPEVN